TRARPAMDGEGGRRGGAALAVAEALAARRGLPRRRRPGEHRRARSPLRPRAHAAPGWACDLPGQGEAPPGSVESGRMFDALSGRVNSVFGKLRSRGKLHPKQVDAALDDMRTALLEADASLDVVDDLLRRVRARALSDEVMRSLTPAHQVVKIVRDELTVTMGGEHKPFTLPGANPVVIMMAGLQGSGKTTHAAKLALHLKEKGRQPLLVAADL